MGYEEMDVDNRIKKYNYFKKYKFDIPTQSHSNNSNFNMSHLKYKRVNNLNVPVKPPKKKFKCRKKFKFSKYHYMSKKPLYDYQIDLCKQGLIDDVLNQIGNILNLIEKCEKKSFINCKIEEIDDFIKYHKIADDSVLKKQKVLVESFKNKFK